MAAVALSLIGEFLPMQELWAWRQWSNRLGLAQPAHDSDSTGLISCLEMRDHPSHLPKAPFRGGGPRAVATTHRLAIAKPQASSIQYLEKYLNGEFDGIQYPRKRSEMSVAYSG